MNFEHRHEHGLGYYIRADYISRQQQTLLEGCRYKSSDCEWRLIEAHSNTDVNQIYPKQLYFQMNSSCASFWVKMLAPYHIALVHGARISDAIIALAEINVEYRDYWYIAGKIASVQTDTLPDWQYSQFCITDQSKQVEWKLRYGDYNWLSRT